MTQILVKCGHGTASDSWIGCRRAYAASVIYPLGDTIFRSQTSFTFTLVLSLSAFGPLRILWNDQPVTGLGSGKLAALLLYLAAQPGQHRRDTLADLFWPDLSAESARLNLRQTVFQLRSVLTEATGRDFLVSGRDLLGIDPDSPHRLSVADLVSPLPVCAGPRTESCAACLSSQEARADACRGPFLADLSLPGCPGFEEWQQCQRESYHLHLLNLLARLSDCHERCGSIRTALPFALRYVELEPLSEAGRLRAMRLLVLDGQPDAALAQFEAGQRVLKRELGVAPGAPLQTFAQRLREEVQNAVPTVPTVLVAKLPEDRRQVTVLYCSLLTDDVDDPEEAVVRLHGPQLRCEEIVRQHGGHLVQNYSGGLLAYFGYPQTIENAALYALQAAQALVAAMTQQVSVGVGVHSGLILTSPEARMPDAIGTTSGIAIRLRDLACAGEVVVSAETRRRTAGYFRFADLMTASHQGLPKDIEVFRVVGVSGAKHRFAPAERITIGEAEVKHCFVAAEQLTPFTGRERELAALLKAWAKAQRGEFRPLIIKGEAGIGKSRLVNTLAGQLSQGSRIVKQRFFAETRHSSLHPVIAFYEDLCQIEAGDNDVTKLAKVKHMLQTRAPAFEQRGLPLLAHMLGLAEEVRPPPPVSSPEQLKAATVELLADLLHPLVNPWTVLFVVEDMHWADASSLEALSILVNRRQAAPVLMLFTARPEWQSPWPDVDVMTLAPLPDGDVAGMVGALRADLAPQQLRHIIAKAEGIPLFAEELAAAHDGRPADDLPANLHDVLMARLDRVGPARALAQLAATIGREFDQALLARVADLTPQILDEAMGRLLASGLVQDVADGRWQFKHALLQEAVYRSQTRLARQAAHRRVALALEAYNVLPARHRPELLAKHWSDAGEAVRAVPYWLQAGQRAAKHFAHLEAQEHYAAGLRDLESLALGSQRDELQLGLLTGLAESKRALPC